MFRQKFFKVSLALMLAGNTFISTAANHYAEEVAEQEMSVPQDEEKKDDGKIDNTVTSSPENNEEQLPEKIPEEATTTPLEPVEPSEESPVDETIDIPIAEEVTESSPPENVLMDEQEKTAINEQKEKATESTDIAKDTDLASGTYGTSPWRIDAQGVLYIDGGELGEATMSVRAPWYIYRSSITKIIFTAPTLANAHSLGLFFDMNQVTMIENLEYLDTSHVGDMRYFFYWCSKLTNLDVSGFDTTNVTNMSYMFYGCSQLVSLDLSTFNTSNVTQMGSIFCDCHSLTSLNVSSFDTSGMTNMSYMFYNCSELTTLDISNFDTGNVDDMSHMFRSCSKLTQLDVSGLDTHQVTDMSFMFYGCSGLRALSLQNFDTAKVLNMHYMFYNCAALTSLPVEGFDTSRVTSMRYMFYGCHNLTDVDVSNFDTRNVTTMSYMFYGCSALAAVDVSNFATPKIKFMNYMFTNCSKLKALDISAVSTGALEEMNQSFSGMSQLSTLTLGPNFQFLSEANLPAIPTVEPNTGYWQNVGAGTVAIPKGDHILTSDQLMATYTGTMADTYVWQKTLNLESISVKDATLYVNDLWDPADNFISATDKDGNAMDFDPSMVTGTVDTSVAGITPITYTNGSASQVSTVTVKENLESIVIRNSVLYVGDKWDPAANFVSATDKDGNSLAFDPTMVTGDVNVKVPGNYQVTYTNGSASQLAEVTVKENKETIVVKDLTIYVGDTWNPADQFISATDKAGSPLFFIKEMVSGVVDSKKIGTYKVVFRNGQAEQQTTVTVKENKETIHAKDSTLSVGDSWDPLDNFLSATDKEGKSVPFEMNMVDGSVDTSKVGIYPVTYKNGRKSVSVFIHVVKKETNSKPKPPNQNGQTPTDNTNNQQTTTPKATTKPASSTTNEGKNLPKTGERHSFATALGFGILAVALTLIYKKDKKSK
ncbi:bacterial Ig-like domain-containing protein [Enterococcus durans]|uniref:BspA family leucine-rich repeat surface protein n=2 Tax=Enterococcus durans TaxID=53345 RepID=A0AB36S934_9ENTE|nr:bacterial Ig-like domain-containing protein [Enterococcus durans]EOT36061.1 hypothetical protein OMS_00262 [Enterococcus durans ATCC 6056]EOU19007.1 hypothetical protein I571_02007 [Enterococcus durans ATCC 6056]PEH44927.1 BspA family leucine-rich repeat surface protein [Enterococcus durans]QPQ26177.1 BspA family leucine-rich repeat surface protein [Enterococcus durans]QXB37964.1 BspA family leucine-rich repeat surface protein [Enterococcus durans]